jgi:hypothetical protein
MNKNYQQIIVPSSDQYNMIKLDIAPGEWNSLYLKVLPVDLIVDGKIVSDEKSLKNLIENKLRLGKVERIDFSKRRNYKGDTVTSAYIHFFMWDNRFGLSCRTNIDLFGRIVYHGYTINNHLSDTTIVPFIGQWHNGVSSERFLEFKKNINPISQSSNADLNVNQLISKIELQDKRILELYEKVNNFIDNERKNLLDQINNKKKKNNTNTNDTKDLKYLNIEPNYRSLYE